jgi:alpha-beta hydrolase superfamily lysophospholipase
VTRPAGWWRRLVCVGAAIGVIHCDAPAHEMGGRVPADERSPEAGPLRTGAWADTLAKVDTRAWVDTRRAYVMRTAGGDTIATEMVDEGAGWMESVLQMARRGEGHRVVVTLEASGTPSRWDVHRAWSAVPARPDEWWRVLVRAESLYVVQGALIGVPVAITAVEAPVSVAPWHDASVALLELLARRTEPTLTAVSVARADRPRPVRVQRPRADSIRLVHPDGDWFLSLDGDGRVQRAASPARGLQVERTALPPPASRVDTAQRWDVTVEAVRVRAHDGVRLAGEYVRPLTGTVRSVVVFVSGSGPQDRDLAVPGLPQYRPFAELAYALAARGVGSVRVDDRGVGASGGAAFRSSRQVEALDVHAVLAWLHERVGQQAVPVALVGHSDGAHVALDVAAADARVGRVVLLAAPARSGRELARAQRRQWLAGQADTTTASDRRAHEAALQRAEAATERLAALDPWMHDWLDHDPQANVPAVAAEVLLVHGEQDRQVPVAHAAELAALLRARGTASVQLRRVPGVNHLLLADSIGDPQGYARLATRTLPASLREAIVQWLSR